MKKLHVIDYLNNGGTYESLFADHAVQAKPHNGKVSFVYDQIAAREDDPLACQCRGLVLREGTWDVLAYPFDRFFNHGQGVAATIDWSTAAFEEKLDGTLIIAYWDGVANRWHVATRSMCEAHGDINGVGTFAALADSAARQMGVGAASFHQLMEGVAADRRVTYMFELTGPYNTVVVRYEKLRLTLLGARHLGDFGELDPRIVAGQHGFTPAKRWEFSNLDHMIEVAKEWSPLEQEGVVVKDAAFNRIKVKTPQYLAIHHAIDSLGASWRAVCEAILTGHADDIGAAAPPLVKARIDSLRPVLGKVIEHVERDYAELRSIDDMKTFALAAQQRVWAAPLFALKRGKTESLSAFMAKVSADNVLEVCRKLGWEEPHRAELELP